MKITRKLSLPRQLDVMWDNWQSLAALEFPLGKIVSAEPAAATWSLTHGLGRLPKGYILLRAQGVYAFRETAIDTSTITFTGSISGTAYVRMLVW